MEIPETPVEQDILKKITDCVNEKAELDEKLEELERQKKEINLKIVGLVGGYGQVEGKQALIEGRIPALMSEANTELVVTTTGLVVEIEDEIKVPSMAINSEWREPVLKWAEDSGNEKVIKDFVSVPFDKGDLRVKALIAFLNTTGLSYERIRSIHPGTLKSLVNEILEDNGVVPMEQLNIQKYRCAKIKEAKTKNKAKENTHL